MAHLPYSISATFTNGSAVVTAGVGAFLVNVKPGDWVRAPDEKQYFVNSVDGNTQVTLDRDYLGTTATETVLFSKHSEAWGSVAEANVRLAKIDESIARGYTLQSASSLAIGTGSKVFTGVESGLNILDGIRLRATSRANPANFMEGFCTYSGSVITMTVDTGDVGGSGTFSDWNLNVTGNKGSPSGELGSDLDLNGFNIYGDGSVGIGAPVPNDSKLDVRGTGLLFGPLTATGSAGEDAQISAVGYGVGAVMHGWRAEGTEGAPTAVSNGALIFGVGGRSFDGSDWSSHSNAAFHVIATENHSPTNQGARLTAVVTPNGHDTDNRINPCHFTDRGIVWFPDTKSASSWDPTNSAHVEPLSSSPNQIPVLISSADTVANTAAFAVVGYGLATVGFRGANARGTVASPAATQSNDFLCFMGGHGHTGSLWTTGTKALMAFKAAENWTPTANGTFITFETTAVGSSSRTARARVDADGTFRPETDNAYSNGASGARWSVVYAATGTINTSDAREKENIEPLALGLDFLNELRPVTHTWRVGHVKVVVDLEADVDFEGNQGTKAIEVPGTRKHAALLAQDVKAALDARGIDLGMWTLDDASNPDSRQGLRYEQLVPVLIRAVQELSAQVRALSEN